MKKRTFLYIPLTLLFVLSLVVLVLHANQVFRDLRRIVWVSEVRSPFLSDKDGISELRPEGEAAGLRKGDRVLAVNGRAAVDDRDVYEEFVKTRVGDPLNFTVERRNQAGETERQIIAVPATAGEVSLWQRVSDFSIVLIFKLLLPAISFLLGFYVAFVRPRDAQAWILLFLLLGIGSIGMEGGSEGSLIRFFQETALNFYRSGDASFRYLFSRKTRFRPPFPVCEMDFNRAARAVRLSVNLLEQTGSFFGWHWLWESIDNVTEPFDNVGDVF